MKTILHSALHNEALTRITHWTVFGAGLVALSVSVAATIAKAIGI